MNNNKFLIITLIILVAIAAYFFVSKSNSTLGELNDFAIKDTASIDKIFIADATGDKVTLVRGEKHWLVEGKHKARPESMEVIMNTFYQIAVKSPVSKAAQNNVIRDLATTAIKVEIYQGKSKPTKVYYIGGATQNNQGTYMLLENEGVKSSAPFIMYIPGFNGYLTTRFYANANQWRDAAVFTYLPDEIKSISITYFEQPENSFTINQSLGQISLFDENKNAIQQFDTNKVKQYLGQYEKVYYEMVVMNEISQAKKDSVIASQPYFKIEGEDIFGKKTKIVAYHMPNYRQIEDENGVPFQYDVDRMYGYFNNELFVYIQFHTFDKITFPRKIFLK